MKKHLKLSSRAMAAFLAMMMLVAGLPVITATAGSYTMQEILNLTNLPVINLAIEGGQDVDRVVKDNKRNIATFTLDENHDGTNDLVVDYADNPMTIKGRGNSSWIMNTNKKPYNIKFDSKVDLLGMGGNKSWSLISNWVDTTYIRNYIAYKTGKKLNTSAMDCELVELCINGKYEGIYLLTEKYGLGDTRVATAGDGYDVTGDGEVGSFLIETDSRAYTNEEPNKFTIGSTNFVVKDPDEEDLTSDSDDFKNLVSEMEPIYNSVINRTNYEDYIDIDSFIDVYIVNELYKNPDFGYGSANSNGWDVYASTFMYKEEGGKLYFGTIWDFDISMGRNDCSQSAVEGNRATADPEGFLHNNTNFVYQLMQDPYFQQRLKERYTQIRPVLQNILNNVIPDAVEKVSPTVQYDINTWGTAAARTTDYIYRTTGDFAQECAYVQNFISKRLAWLDEQWLLDTTVTDEDIYWARENEVSASGSYSNLTSGSADFANKALVEGTAPAEVLAIYNEPGAVKGMENVFDGGNGLEEIGGTEVTKYGKKSTLNEETGELPSPITITGPTGNEYKWHQGDSVSTGFDGRIADITITKSGRYIYCASTGNQYYWSSGSTFTMSQERQVYIVDVAENGAVTVHDGSITTDGSKAAVLDTKYSNLFKNSENNYTLEFKADESGNAGTSIGGTVITQSISISYDAEELGGDTLYITNRPADSVYADVPALADAVYINFEGDNPASWTVYEHGTTNSANNIASFKASNMLLTAVGAGSVDITAYTANGTASNTITLNIVVKDKTKLVTEANKSMGIYAPSVIGSRDEQNHWATVVNGTMTRFTGYFLLEDYGYAKDYFLGTEDRDQVLGGKADYYIYVNGTPYIKAVYGDDSNLAEDSFLYNFTIGNTSAFKNYERYMCCNENLSDIDSASEGLRELLSNGANRIDVIVKADDDTAILRPYLYSNISDEIIEQIDVTGVALNNDSLDMLVGDEEALSAIISPSNATNRAVNWSSTDSTVASVDTNGKVTALKAGTATITATTVDGGFTASVTVNVTKPEITVEITDGETLSVEVGGEHKLTATVTPAEISDTSVTWSSSDATIAKVGNKGKVTGLSAGTAVITATSNYDNTVFDTITVEVTETVVPGGDDEDDDDDDDDDDVIVGDFTVAISAEKETIGLDETLQLNVEFSKELSDSTVSWWITDNTIGNGYVVSDILHPTRSGYITIMARSNANPIIKSNEITIHID